METYKDSKKTRGKYSKKNWPPEKRISLPKEMVEVLSLISNWQSRIPSNDLKAGLTGYHFVVALQMHMDSTSKQRSLHHKYRSTTLNRRRKNKETLLKLISHYGILQMFITTKRAQMQLVPITTKIWKKINFQIHQKYNLLRTQFL